MAQDGSPERNAVDVGSFFVEAKYIKLLAEKFRDIAATLEFRSMRLDKLRGISQEPLIACNIEISSRSGNINLNSSLISRPACQKILEILIEDTGEQIKESFEQAMITRKEIGEIYHGWTDASGNISDGSEDA